MKKEKAIEGIVSLTHLEGLLERHPYDLSGGEQQRLMLARMLLLKPQVLLLDEATSALDETTAEAMTEMLRLELKNSAILLVTHQSVLLNEGFLCQHTEETSLSHFPDMKTQFLLGTAQLKPWRN